MSLEAPLVAASGRVHEELAWDCMCHIVVLCLPQAPRISWLAWGLSEALTDLGQTRSDACNLPLVKVGSRTGRMVLSSTTRNIQAWRLSYWIKGGRLKILRAEWSRPCCVQGLAYASQPKIGSLNAVKSTCPNC